MSPTYYDEAVQSLIEIFAGNVPKPDQDMTSEEEIQTFLATVLGSGKSAKDEVKAEGAKKTVRWVDEPSDADDKARSGKYLRPKRYHPLSPSSFKTVTYDCQICPANTCQSAPFQVILPTTTASEVWFLAVFRGMDKSILEWNWKGRWDAEADWESLDTPKGEIDAVLSISFLSWRLRRAATNFSRTITALYRKCIPPYQKAFGKLQETFTLAMRSHKDHEEFWNNQLAQRMEEYGAAKNDVMTEVEKVAKAADGLRLYVSAMLDVSGSLRDVFETVRQDGRASMVCPGILDQVTYVLKEAEAGIAMLAGEEGILASHARTWGSLPVFEIKPGTPKTVLAGYVSQAGATQAIQTPFFWKYQCWDDTARTLYAAIYRP